MYKHEYVYSALLYKNHVKPLDQKEVQRMKKYEVMYIIRPNVEEEARKAQERMDAAVKSFALLAMPMMTLDSVNDAGVASLVPLYPDWDPNGHEYYKGDPFIYENRYFRASQDITSSSVYKPGDPGTESLYYEFFIADDGIVIFHEVKGIPELEEKKQEGEDRIEMPEAAKTGDEVQPVKTAEETNAENSQNQQKLEGKPADEESTTPF